MGGLRRLASTALGGTVRGLARVTRRSPRIIFMYHGVGRSPGAVPAAVFEAQLERIRAAGFEVVPLAELASWTGRSCGLPGRAVALTFDDGLADTARVAAPILRRHRVPATLFPVVSFIGGPRRFGSERAGAILETDDGDAATRPWDYMTWDELDAWVEAGGGIGGHTMTHPRLGRLDPVSGLEEIRGCRDALAKRYGQPPSIFCYPFGDDSGEAPIWVARAGFEAAVTTREGVVVLDDDLLRLPRLPAPATAGPAFDDFLFGIFHWRRRLAAALPGVGA